MTYRTIRRGAVVLALGLLFPGLTAVAQEGKVPITASDEAVELYLQGRDLADMAAGLAAGGNDAVDSLGDHASGVRHRRHHREDGLARVLHHPSQV